MLQTVHRSNKVSIHDKSAAEILGSIAGGSFISSHWFMVADTLVHFLASSVAIITGVPAAIFYVRHLINWVKGWIRK